MKKQTKIANLIIVLSSVLLFKCAQFVPPTGGKKDEKNPKLISSMPTMAQKNFKEKTIELTFDELIDITSIRQELLIIPEIENTYNVKMKGNKVILKFDKPFKDSTTYTLNFRKGIKDLNERNESKNLKLVFSTSNIIDSLKISGTVNSLLSNKPVLEANVSLYKIRDSLNLKTTKPDYFTKTDSSGNFSFENIKNAKYRIYAFIDKNNNLRFDKKTEPIGFIKDTLILNKNISGLKIDIYNANNDKAKNIKTIQRAEDYSIMFDKNIKNMAIQFSNKNDSLPYTVSGKELKFYNTKQLADTIKAEIKLTDSSNTVLQYVQKIKFREPDKKKKDKKDTNFDISISPKAGADIEKILVYTLDFDVPIEKFDLEKIILLADTTNKEKIELSDLNWNEYKTKLKIEKQIKAERDVKLKIEHGAFINIKGDSNKVETIINPILKSENYGLVEGRTLDKTSKKIIQLVNDKYEVVAEQKTKEKFLFKNVKPNIYLIRIIEDLNDNGYWDFGDVEKHILPEPIKFYEEPIKIKANFELTGLLIK